MEVLPCESDSLLHNDAVLAENNVEQHLTENPAENIQTMSRTLVVIEIIPKKLRWRNIRLTLDLI